MGVSQRGKKGQSKGSRQMIKEFLLVSFCLGLLVMAGFVYKNQALLLTKVRNFWVSVGNNSSPDELQGVREMVGRKVAECLYGIDVSHYQGKIHWDQLQGINPEIPVSFVILRATMGNNGRDRHFSDYWLQAKWKKIPRGAYHYFRPNEPGLEQALHYIREVKLSKGDLPPIVDIEKEPRKKRIGELRRELKIFLDAVEAHYRVKPIIYTMDSFFQSYLSNGDFDGYPLWIANYNLSSLPRTGHWVIWQFSEKGRVKGVDEYVDLNIFRGSKRDFGQLLID